MCRRFLSFAMITVEPCYDDFLTEAGDPEVPIPLQAKHPRSFTAHAKNALHVVSFGAMSATSTTDKHSGFDAGDDDSFDFQHRFWITPFFITLYIQ
jgi:hypothetical protein